MQSVSPGAVETEIFEVAGLTKEGLSVAQGAFLKSEDISDAILYLLSTPTSVNITELTIRPLNSPM